MLMNTRRRVLALLAASRGPAPDPLPAPRSCQDPDCFATQAIGPWKGVATQDQAGARISQLAFTNPDKCDLRAEISVGANFDGKLVLYGDPDKTPLPKPFLIKPENRLIIRSEDGKVALDEPLCGTCTEIHDDKVTVILPLAAAPLFRDSRSLELAVKLGEAEECRVKLDCETLRKALAWAAEKQTGLANNMRRKAAPRRRAASSPAPAASCSVWAMIASSCAPFGAIATPCSPNAQAAERPSHAITPRRRSSLVACLPRRARRACYVSMPASSCLPPSPRGWAVRPSPTGSMRI